MRSEQILTQQHLIEKRMQPLPFINLVNNLTIFFRMFIRIRFRIAIVHFHFYCKVCKCTFGRNVLLFNLRRVLFLFWFFISLLNSVLFVLDVFVIGNANRGVLNCIHILSQIRMTTTTSLSRIKRGKLWLRNNNRICLLHF